MYYIWKTPASKMIPFDEKGRKPAKLASPGIKRCRFVISGGCLLIRCKSRPKVCFDNVKNEYWRWNVHF